MNQTGDALIETTQDSATNQQTVERVSKRASGSVDLNAFRQKIIDGTTCKELMETFNLTKGQVLGLSHRNKWPISTNGQAVEGEGGVRPPRPVKPKAERKPREPRVKKPAQPRTPKTPAPKARSYSGHSLRDRQDPRIPRDISDEDVSANRDDGMVMDAVASANARTRGMPRISLEAPKAQKKVRAVPTLPYIPNPRMFYDDSRDMRENICRWPTGKVSDPANSGYMMEVCGVTIGYNKTYCVHCEDRLYADRRDENGNIIKVNRQIKTRAELMAETCVELTPAPAVISTEIVDLDITVGDQQTPP